MGKMSLWFDKGRLLFRKGKLLFCDACPCCQCKADAAKLSRVYEPKSILRVWSPGGLFQGFQAMGCTYSATAFVYTANKHLVDVWSWQVYYSGIGEMLLDLTCTGNKWYATGYMANYDRDNKKECYYIFDEAICPLPAPRVIAGRMSGSFKMTLSRKYPLPYAEAQGYTDNCITEHVTLTFASAP